MTGKAGAEPLELAKRVLPGTPPTREREPGRTQSRLSALCGRIYRPHDQECQ
jgi:hypothetical protein